MRRDELDHGVDPALDVSSTQRGMIIDVGEDILQLAKSARLYHPPSRRPHAMALLGALASGGLGNAQDFPRLGAVIKAMRPPVLRGGGFTRRVRCSLLFFD
jgi:hypothetical protein